MQETLEAILVLPKLFFPWEMKLNPKLLLLSIVTNAGFCYKNSSLIYGYVCMAQYSTDISVYPQAIPKLMQTGKQKPYSHWQLNWEAVLGTQRRYHWKATVLLPVSVRFWPVITQGSLHAALVCSIASTQWEKKNMVKGQWGRVEPHKSWNRRIIE